MVVSCTLNANQISWVVLFELLVWPHEVEPWIYSYSFLVENLDAKYLSLNCYCDHMKWTHDFILGTEVT